MDNINNQSTWCGVIEKQHKSHMEPIVLKTGSVIESDRLLNGEHTNYMIY